MCALYNEGIGGPVLSRIRLTGNSLTAEFGIHMCRQCLAPSCYEACPLKDEAMCIDESNGIKFINEDKCVGCKACISACPFIPAEIMFNEEKNRPFKCDLCRGRDEGPICVEYCPVGALKIMKSRKGGNK